MGDTKSIPRKETHSAGDFALLGESDIDCFALWGRPSIGVSVGGVGNLVVTKLDGTDATIPLAAYPAGYMLPIQVRAVKVTGTTCTGVIVYVAQVGG